ncbi:MAG: hypothetical protein ACKO6N_29530 [Myxococcota bacterium]
MTSSVIKVMTQESGTSSRTFKSALLWAVAEDEVQLREDARKLLAWKGIQDEADELGLDEAQRKSLEEQIKGSESRLKETVWRTYKNIYLLAEDNTLRKIDLGLVNSSAAHSLVELMLSRLKLEDLVVDGVSATSLIKYWPPALPEWNTKSVRDAFYASPKFPRLLKADAVKATLAKGITDGLIAYVGKDASGQYEPFMFKTAVTSASIEIADYFYIIPKEKAETYLAQKAKQPVVDEIKDQDEQDPEESDGEDEQVKVDVKRPQKGVKDKKSETTHTDEDDKKPAVSVPEVAGFRWSGEVPAQKWMNFYTKVLSRFVTGGGLKLKVSIEVLPVEGISQAKVDETTLALRELGLAEGVEVVRKGK